jgi:hypothetical protein
MKNACRSSRFSLVPFPRREMNTMVSILFHRSDWNEHHGGHFKPKLETITVVITSEEITTTLIIS